MLNGRSKHCQHTMHRTYCPKSDLRTVSAVSASGSRSCTLLGLELVISKAVGHGLLQSPQALVGSDADLSHVWAGSLQPRLYDTMPAIATCSSTKPIESHGKSTVICQVEAVHQAHSPDFIA